MSACTSLVCCKPGLINMYQGVPACSSCCFTDIHMAKSGMQVALMDSMPACLIPLGVILINVTGTWCYNSVL